MEKPGNMEMVGLIRQRLDSLEGHPKTDTEWTQAVKTTLCLGAARLGLEVRASGVGKLACPEKLYDVSWLYRERHVLVAECEWTKSEVSYDFEKLFVAKAGVRVMIFTGTNEAGSVGTANMLAHDVRPDDFIEQDDVILLAAWEGRNEDWRFRWFTIEPREDKEPGHQGSHYARPLAER